MANNYCCQWFCYTCTCVRFLVLWVVQLIYQCGGKKEHSYFPLFISVTGACLLGGVGLMAGLSGFASHQCSLHLGAGCQ